MSPYGRVHLVFSLLAIVAGGWVMFMRKGTRFHRTLGHLYVWSMAGVLVSSFSIYGRTGHWGPFHWMAVAASVTLIGGLWSVLARRPRKNWVDAHAIWMSWSYIGLMAAAAAESSTQFLLPKIRPYLESHQLFGAFWGMVAFASFAVVGVGWWLVKTRLQPAVARASRG